jgi:uncharacterized protein (UPF0261 family)
MYSRVRNVESKTSLAVVVPMGYSIGARKIVTPVTGNLPLWIPKPWIKPEELLEGQVNC